MHDHIRAGEELVDRGLDGLHHGPRVFEGDVALERQPQIREQPVAALPNSDSLKVQYARNTGDGFGDLGRGALGCRIHQRIERPPSQAHADVDGDPRYH